MSCSEISPCWQMRFGAMAVPTILSVRDRNSLFAQTRRELTSLLPWCTLEQALPGFNGSQPQEPPLPLTEPGIIFGGIFSPALQIPQDRPLPSVIAGATPPPPTHLTPPPYP